MKDVLRQHITLRLGREPENLHLVLPHFEELKVKRGTHLLMSGDVCRYVYFVVQGCLQVYVNDKSGNASTREFYPEDHWCTDIFGFQNQKPSSEYIKAIEPTSLLRIHFDSFQAMSRDVPQFAAIYKQLLETSYNNTIYRLNTLTSMDALDRIKWLMDHKPKLMRRLSNKLLASYLGISAETMTRLKARL